MRPTIDDRDQRDEATLIDDIPDQALEIAAGIAQTAVYTLGNCTGLESCPA